MATAKYFKTSEFDSKISYSMFLHDYLLACEKPTVRTLAFNFQGSITTRRAAVHSLTMAYWRSATAATTAPVMTTGS